MYWLTGGLHRIWATVFLVAVLLIAGNALAEDNVRYSEGAAYIQLQNGEKWMCLLRGVGYEEEVPEGWIPVTCTDLKNKINWQVCWLKKDSPQFMCRMPEAE